jgi:hypothetical protein
MNDDLSSLLPGFDWAPTGASLQSIRSVETQLAIVFPTDYVALLQVSNGGEGHVASEGYLQLWAVGRLPELNAAYQAPELYPGFVLLGSNGGGEAIALRSGANGPELFLMPFIGDTSDALFGGRSLVEFLSSYGSGRIWKREPR